MKSLFNKTLFLEQIKRFYTVGVLALFVYIFFIIIPTVVGSPSFTDIGYPISVLFENNGVMLFDKNIVLIICNIVFPLALVCLTFFYLFNENASISILAFPIKRNALWFTNVLVCLILLAVPIVIFCLGLVFLLSIANSSALTNLMPSLMSFLFITLFRQIFYFNVFLFIAHICGNVFGFIVTSFILPIIPFTFIFVVTMYMNLYWIGISIPDNLIEFMASTLDINFYLILISVLFVLSFFCNRIRDQDYVGETFVFKPVKNFMICSIAILAMLITGYYFLLVFRSFFMMYVIMFFVFIIAYYISQMIAEKTFNIFSYATKHIYKYFVVGLLTLVLLLSVTKYDLFGVASYVPKIDEIDSVNLSGEGYTNNADTILETRNVHENIIQNKNTFVNNMIDPNLDNEIYSDIFYKLKNGKIVSRFYIMDFNLAEKVGLADLLNKKDVILSNHTYLNDLKDIAQIKVYKDLKNVVIADQSKISALIELIKKDILVGDHDLLKKRCTGQYSNPDTWLSFEVTLNKSKENNRKNILTEPANTKKWLMDNGYTSLFN